MQCASCGREIKSEYDFCAYCGAKIVEASKPVVEVAPTRVTFTELFINGLSSLNPFKQTEQFQKVTDVVYRKRSPHSPVNIYLFLGIGMAIVFLLLDYTTEWLSNMSMTLIGFIAPIIYFVWMYRNDRYEKEPLSLIVFLASWGIISAFIAGYLNSYIIIPLLGAPGAAFTEEPLKAVGVYWLARHKRHGDEFNDHLDGMVYGSAVGAGFAGSENFYYIYRYVMEGIPLTEIALIRSIAALGHLVYTGLIGRVLGVAKVRRGKILLTDLLAALPAGIIPHFVWNTFPDFFGLTGILILYVVYAYVFSKNIVAAQRDEERWNFKVYAPLE